LPRSSDRSTQPHQSHTTPNQTKPPPPPARAAAAAAAPADDGGGPSGSGDDSGGDDSGGDDSGGEEGQQLDRRRSHAGASARREAILAMQRGDGVLNEGRYKDQSFFLSHTREGR
jgi:hypothetical protein